MREVGQCWGKLLLDARRVIMRRVSRHVITGPVVGDVADE
jgi:hypothetical protein